MPFQPKLHLFSILNDPCNNKECLVVMVTTLHEGRKHDPSCVLNAGDHPFITHPSYMLYRLAETVRADHIQTRIGQKIYIPREDFPPAVFERIVDGLYASDETRARIVKYAEENGI